MLEEMGFERQLADYKAMVILRQEECVRIAELLETAAGTGFASRALPVSFGRCRVCAGPTIVVS